MVRTYTMGTVMGVPVRVSWTAAAGPAVVAILTFIRFRFAFPGPTTVLLAGEAGVLGGVIFFAVIFLHELAHAVTGIGVGIQPEAITLDLRGGLTRFPHWDAPVARLLICLAGPASGFALVGLFVDLERSLQGIHPQLSFFCLTVWNFVLIITLSNLLPVRQFDGERIVRSVLELAVPSPRVVEQMATAIDWVTAVSASVAGLSAVLGWHILPDQTWPLGPMFVCWIGLGPDRARAWFRTRDLPRQPDDLELPRLLSSVRATDLMHVDTPDVPPDSVIATIMAAYPVTERQVAYCVREAGRAVGFLPCERLTKMPEVARYTTTVAAMMLGPAELLSTLPESNGAELIHRMMAEKVRWMSVVTEDGTVLGFVTVSGVLSYAATALGSMHFAREIVAMGAIRSRLLKRPTQDLREYYAHRSPGSASRS